MWFSYISSHYSTLGRFIWIHYYDCSQLACCSVGRALHQYHRDHGFKSHTGLNFFFSRFISNTSSVVFVAIRIAHISFLLTVHIYDFHIFPVIIYHLKVYLDPALWPAPSWLVSSVGRALHWYRRGHGFKSCMGLNLFFRSHFNY